MKYTLYIDESGDFETPRGEWVLAGVLFSDTYENCENAFFKKLNSFPKKVGLHSIKEFHLTEFRRDLGHDQAIEIAGQLFKQIDSLPFSYYGIAAINYSKSSLSEREKTYRLMVSDLLAVCETAIPDNADLSRLDIVVASRTINGIKQTNISDIHHDVIGALPAALEIDLATKGLLEIMGKNIKVHMDYANNSWGLVCADFLANINYHHRKEKEKNLLSQLNEAGKFFCFESFGGTNVRRARVAERNKDYASAIQRWVDIAIDDKINEETNKAIYQLFGKLLFSLGTSGYKVAFESLLDLLWRANNSVDGYRPLCLKLKYLDSCLSHFLVGRNEQKYEGLTFRLRNLLLIVLNHLARADEALKLIQGQNALVPSIAANPELFQLILNFKVAETETHINCLDLKVALKLACEYSELVENYKGLWQLLLSDDDVIGFESSNVFIKSEMALFRIFVLAMDVVDIKGVGQIEDRVAKLQQIVNHPLDRSRLNNYQVMYHLKQRNIETARSLMLSYSEDWGLYDFHWFMRVVNELLLSATIIEVDAVSKIVDEQLTKFNLNVRGHPIDVLLRELALYEFQLGNSSKAKKYIVKSRAATDVADANIIKFLDEVGKVHEDYIFGRLQPNSSYFKSINNDVTKSIYEKRLGMTFLQRVRHFSFY
jgi:hypothetical protein